MSICTLPQLLALTALASGAGAEAETTANEHAVPDKEVVSIMCTRGVPAQIVGLLRARIAEVVSWVRREPRIAVSSPGSELEIRVVAEAEERVGPGASYLETFGATTLRGRISIFNPLAGTLPQDGAKDLLGFEIDSASILKGFDHELITYLLVDVRAAAGGWSYYSAPRWFYQGVPELLAIRRSPKRAELFDGHGRLLANRTKRRGKLSIYTIGVVRSLAVEDFCGERWLSAVFSSKARSFQRALTNACPRLVNSTIDAVTDDWIAQRY